jgi:hypothetical protein
MQRPALPSLTKNVEVAVPHPSVPQPPVHRLTDHRPVARRHRRRSTADRSTQGSRGGSSTTRYAPRHEPRHTHTDQTTERPQDKVAGQGWTGQGRRWHSRQRGERAHALPAPAALRLGIRPHPRLLHRLRPRGVVLQLVVSLRSVGGGYQVKHSVIPTEQSKTTATLCDGIQLTSTATAQAALLVSQLHFVQPMTIQQLVPRFLGRVSSAWRQIITS